MGARLDISVLYVEDDAVTRQRFAAIMARQVREVREAADGAEGLDLYRAMQPDIVVSDIRMPKMTGLEMATEIRRLEPEARIILTTAYSDKEFLLAAIEAGINNYISKPIDADRLAKAIAQSAEIITLKRQIRAQEEAQRQLVAELQQAVAEINTLKGFIPICASCKDIRNDHGYWEGVEKYVMARSVAQFTHSICPKCVKKLYPELEDD